MLAKEGDATGLKASALWQGSGPQTQLTHLHPDGSLCRSTAVAPCRSNSFCWQRREYKLFGIFRKQLNIFLLSHLLTNYLNIRLPYRSHAAALVWGRERVFDHTHKCRFKCSHQSLVVKSIPSRMFSSVSCRPLVYTTTMYRTCSDHALSSRTAWTGRRDLAFYLKDRTFLHRDILF